MGKPESLPHDSEGPPSGVQRAPARVEAVPPAEVRDADRGFEARLQLGATLLSMLVALISVCGVVAPILRETFFGGPRLRVELDRVQQQVSSGAFGDEGKRAAYMIGVDFEGGLIVANSGTESAYLRSANVVLEVTGSDRIGVDGNKTRLPLTKTAEVTLDHGRKSEPGQVDFVPFRTGSRLDLQAPLSEQEFQQRTRLPVAISGRLQLQFVHPDLSEQVIEVPLGSREYAIGKD